MKIRVLLLLFALHLAAVPLRLCADEPSQNAKTVDIQLRTQMKCLLSLPDGYDGSQPTPLLLFLHGAGERGTDLGLVKKHGPPKLLEAGKRFPFIVVSPQCPEGRWWEAAELSALLDRIELGYNVDSSRVYVTGLSMGGFGTWRLAFYDPDHFAAIAPICGGGETYWAERIAGVPVWAFHGAKDKGVPLARSRSMIDALKKEGADPKLTIYPNAEHDSWTETYENPELYEWLLSHQR